MTQINEGLSNHLLQAYTAAFGAGSVLELREGETVVAAVELPGQAWTADERAVDVNGAWSGVAQAGGTVDNYVLRSPGSQFTDTGTVSGLDGGGDMRLDNPSIVTGQSLLINSFRKEL